jgi:hypothetical protein
LKTHNPNSSLLPELDFFAILAAMPLPCNILH